MNINEAKLVSFVTSLYNNGAMTAEQINALFEYVRDCYPVQSEPEPVKVDLKPLFDALANNQKIEAIKEHRKLAGLFLKESKDEVERVMNKLNGK